MTARMRTIFLLALLCLPSGPMEGQGTSTDDAREFIGWLLQDDRELKGIPFPEVVLAVSGKKVIPLSTNRVDDRELLARIGRGLDEVLRRMNAADNAIHKQKRINEVSSHFEDELKRVFAKIPGFSCDYPKTAAGKVQRPGYPDLRLVDQQGGRVVYLDPKLYEAGGRDSTFRTFYFEPKKETNKILDDGHHLIVGFEHVGRIGGGWRFTRWDLVDLSKFKVRLKAEFQGGNRDLYRPETVVGSSGR